MNHPHTEHHINVAQHLLKEIFRLTARCQRHALQNGRGLVAIANVGHEQRVFGGAHRHWHRRACGMESLQRHMLIGEP